MNDIPVVKPFTVKNRCYVYDTYTNQILLVPRDVYAEIYQLMKIGISGYTQLRKKTKAYNELLSLIDNGFFKSSFIKTIKNSETEYIVTMIERCVRCVQLQVTRNCNFKCVYCSYAQVHKIERQHDTVNMSWDIAKSSIDFLYMHSKDSPQVAITFYGGEPLLNYNLIKRSIEYSHSLFFCKDLSYHITTNASLLNEEILRFFIKYRVNILISLDGDRYIQNKHRRYAHNGNNTFDDVLRNIKKIYSLDKKYFEQHVRYNAVIFEDESKEDTFTFFRELGIRKAAVMIDYADKRGVDYMPSYNQARYDKYITSKKRLIREDKYIKFDNILNTKNAISTEWHHNGSCIPGVSRLFVNVYGDFFPCEKTSEISSQCIGNVQEGLDVSKVTQLSNIGFLTQYECMNCWMMRFCDICLIKCFDVEKNELSAQTKQMHCNLQKSLVERYLKDTVDKNTK